MRPPRRCRPPAPRHRRPHSHHAHTAAPAPPPPTRVSAAAKRARRRAAKAAAAGLPPPPDEANRRSKQSALRALALKVRAQGEAYNKWKARRAVENGAAGLVRKQGRQAKEKSGDGDGAGPAPAAKPASKPARTPAAPPPSSIDALVLPIFWNRRPDEKAAVLEAARAAAAVLRGAGLKISVDDDDAKSPGQKMGAADAAGVRVRVEIGPRDVAPGTASVAVSAGAGGGVAPRTPVADRGAALVAAVLKALGRGGEVTVTKEPAPTAPAKEAKKAKKARKAEPAAAAVAAPSPTPEPAPAPPAPPTTTGEGLDDDFGDALLAGVESEGDGRAGKKRKKKKGVEPAADPAPAAAPATRRAREVAF